MHFCCRNRSVQALWSREQKRLHNRVRGGGSSHCMHWQESRSRKISRRNYSFFSRSLGKTEFSFLFLFSISKIFRKIILFVFLICEIFKAILFLFLIFKIFKKKSLSPPDWWDSETQFFFFFFILRKTLFLFSIYEILENNSLFLFRSKSGRWGGHSYL